MDSSHNYKMLLGMGILHLPIMYLIMFVMVDTWDDVEMNLNTFYMALMMASPMVTLMPLFMMKMYSNKKMNVLIYSSSFLILICSYYFIREQIFIGDRQFIKSMIPHHSGAILMCQKAKLLDPELKSLCNNIASGQRQEIEQMERILNRL